jgi:hypothetical protein
MRPEDSNIYISKSKGLPNLSDSEREIKRIELEQQIIKENIEDKRYVKTIKIAVLSLIVSICSLITTIVMSILTYVKTI